MKKQSKKLVSLVLAVLLMLALSSATFAEGEFGIAGDVVAVPAERYIDPATIVGANSVNGNFSGYNNIYLTKTCQDSFDVVVTGSTGFSAGITIKTESNHNSSYAVVTVTKPDGSIFLYQVPLSANDEEQFEFYLPFAGTYHVDVGAYVPEGYYTRVNVWIYG